MDLAKLTRRAGGESGAGARSDPDDGRALRPLAAFGLVEDLVHYTVALILLAVAGIVLYRTVQQLAESGTDFIAGVTAGINGVLFAIIVMEVLGTVLAHFRRGGLQLQPFLIIGIISALREILAVGARLSLQAEGVHRLSPGESSHLLVELGVNASVVLGLAVALVLVRRFAGLREP